MKLSAGHSQNASSDASMGMSTAECHDRGHTEWISSFVESTRRSTEWRGAMSYITIWSLAALSKHERFEKSLTFLTDLPADEQGQLIDSIERSRLPSDHAYQHFCQVVAGRLDSTVRGIADVRCALSGATRSQLSEMVEVASEGSAGLLAQWPGLFDLLQAIPFSSLPGQLRCKVWEMRLLQYFAGIPLAENLKSTESDMHAWQICRDVMALLGVEELSSHTLAMKEVICHLRRLHQGRMWTPLYLALSPLVLVCRRAASLNSAAESKAGAGGGEAAGGGRAWCSDRVWANGALDGRGMLRCWQAVVEATGLADALLDPYSMEPKPLDAQPGGQVYLPGGARGLHEQGGGAPGASTPGRGAEWSAFVYAVSDCLHEMDAGFHDTLCGNLWQAPQQAGSLVVPAHASSGPDDDGNQVQLGLRQAWDLRPEAVAGLAAGVARSDVEVRERMEVRWRLDAAGHADHGGAGAGRGEGEVRGARPLAAAKRSKLMNRDGAVLGALVLPMVQRLFVGVVGGLDVALFLWDVLMAHGSQALPCLCAASVLALRSPLQAQVSEHGSWEALQRNLHMASKGVELWQVRSIVHAMLAAEGKPFPQALSTSLTRTPSLLRSLSYARHGAPGAPAYDLGSLARNGPPAPLQAHHSHAPAGLQPAAHAAEMPASFKIRVRRDSTNSAPLVVATQTDHHVTTLSTPQAVMSSAHQSIFVDSVLSDRPEGASASTSDVHVPFSPASSPKVARVVQGGAHLLDHTHGDSGNSQAGISDREQSIRLEYGGMPYSIKLPPTQSADDRVSSVADKILADHENESFIKAAIQHESVLPCPVARCQGPQYALRMPQTSRAETELWDALVHSFPLLPDDYACPMLRVDLSSDGFQNPRQVYLPPLQDSKGEYLIGGVMSAQDRRTAGMSTTGLDAMLSPRQKKDIRSMAMVAVSAAIEAQGICVSDGEIRMMTDKLIEYSGPHSKWAIRHDRRRGVIGDPVGISLTLDQDFDAWIVDSKINSSANVLSAVRDGEFAQKVRVALATLLQIPPSCIQMAGLHRGSIIVDFNLLQPPGDLRTPLQLYEQLAALVADPDAPIKHDPTLSNTIRVHLRGVPHSIPHQQVVIQHQQVSDDGKSTQIENSESLRNSKSETDDVELSASESLSRISARHVHGLAWKDVGFDVPTPGHEIDCQELSEALKTRTAFTREEMVLFGLPRLSNESYIKVGEKYFKPVAGQDSRPLTAKDGDEKELVGDANAKIGSTPDTRRERAAVLAEAASRPLTANNGIGDELADGADTKIDSTAYTRLERAAILAEAADRLQVGWANKKYFFSSNGKDRSGPVRWEEFAELFHAHGVDRETFIWYKSLSGWSKLKKIPGLMDALRAYGVPKTDGSFVSSSTSARANERLPQELPKVFDGTQTAEYTPEFVLAVHKLQEAFRERNKLRHGQKISKVDHEPAHVDGQTTGKVSPQSVENQLHGAFGGYDEDNLDEHSITTLPPLAVEAGAQDIPVSSKIALSKRKTDILQSAHSEGDRALVKGLGRWMEAIKILYVTGDILGAGAGHKSAEGEDLNVLEQGNSDVAGSTAAKEGYQEHFPPAPSGAVATVPSTPSDGGHDGGVGGAGAGGVGDREVEGRQGEA